MVNYKFSPTLFTIIFGLIVFITGCGTFEVGIETPASPTLLPETIPTEEIIIPSATPPPTKVPEPTPPANEDARDFPDMVSLGHLAPFGSHDIGLIVVQDEEVTVESSPVDFGLFWGYSPQTGKLAYSSEFFHGAENDRASISDLWVYDYQTGSATQWLEDNVSQAAWAPDGEHLTAAVYNPETDQIDLVLLSGPDKIRKIAECASMTFSWSPTGDKLAFVNARVWLNFGLHESCLGTYLVTFPNGISGDEWEVSQVSDFGTQETNSNHFSDSPLWVSKQNGLIYPDQPFWVVPLDGSPAFIPQTPNGEDPMEVPRLFGNLWAADLNQLIGNFDVGLSGNGGVWIYQLSEDLTEIEEYYRIGDIPSGDNSFITLVDWWNPGESILVLNGDNPDTSQYLSEVWRGPAVWSLIENRWLNSLNR
jgi:hypothetical protein